ncbi:MAG: hypothetical protein V7754_05065 [Halioglobus sp.]
MLKFFKSAVFNGLLILLPVLFLIIILKEFAGLLIGLATPIADLFPIDAIEGIPETNILAVLLIVGASFLVGVISLLPVGASIGRYFERSILEKLPVYIPLKHLLQALLGAERSGSFKPAFLIGDSGVLEPAYIVEDTGRPRLVVLVPWTPASFAGSLRVVPRKQVHKLDLTLDEFSLAIGHYGIGLSELIPETPEELKLAPEEEG